MATRTSQIVINVDDKSLVELNNEIKILETSIKNLKINSAEWIAQNEKLGKLKTQFNQATTEAKKLQQVVQKVSGAEQLRSVLKLGNGMIGAFAGLGGVIKLLGGTGDKFNEVSQKALMLVQTMEGLGRLAESFSATNLKGLKSVGVGFKTLVTTVKGASTAMKAALISTGIGALIVAVGLLIANFDKIKKLLGAGKAQKEAEDIYKLSQQATKLAEQEYQTKLKLIEANEKTYIIGKNTQRTNEEFLRNQEALYDIADAKYNATIKQLEEEQKYYNTITKTNKEFKGQTEEQINAAKALSLERQKTLEQEKDIALAGAAIQLILKNSAEKAYDITEAIRLTEIDLTKTSALLYSEQKQYELKLESLKEQKALIEETNVSYTYEVRNQLDTLDAQIEALKTQNNIRKEALRNELLQLNYEKTYQDLINDINSSFQFESDLLAQQVNQHEEISTYFDQQIQSVDSLNKKYTELVKQHEQLINFDKKGKEIFDEQNAVLIEQLGQYNDIYEQVRNVLEADLEGKDISEKLLSIGARELSLYQMINEAKIQKLEYDNQSSELEIKNINLQKEQLDLQDKIIQDRIKYQKGLLEEAQAKLEASKSEEERKARLEDVYAIENQIAELNQSVADNKTKTIELDGQIVAAENEILTTTAEINKTVDDTNKKQKEITDEIENQSRAYQKLQDFVGKYRKEIDTVGQVLGQSMELVATLFDNKAKAVQRQIDSLTKQYSDMNEEEASRQERLKEYEEELKDANGERYDELLKLIDQEKQAKNENFIDEKAQKANLEALDKKRKDEELKAARWRKAQAIIDSIIQTSLAIIEALPNVFLSVAVGILGAASIATIAAQNVQPYKEGGFTLRDRNKNKPVGIVHANEYVVPANIVESESAQAHIAALERQRIRGYQEGGYIPPALPENVSVGFDYDKLITGLADAIMKMPNPQVGLVNISNGLREVQLTKNNAGLTR